jgi:hypothetical protein
MKWFNSYENELPEPDQKVLISINRVYHSARFDKSLKGFQISDGGFFLVKQTQIYWTTDFTDPEMQSEIHLH